MVRSDLTGFLNTIIRKKGLKAAEGSYTEKNSKLTGTDYSVYSLTVADRVREGLTGIGLCAAISYTFYKSIWVFAISAPAAFIVFPHIRKKQLCERRKRQLKQEFKEEIWMLSGFISAGISVENAFRLTLPELEKMYGSKAMMVSEIQDIVRGIKLNKPIEPLLKSLAARSGLDEIRSFAEVFVIARRNGGSLKEIIDRTGRIIRDEAELSEEIQNITAAKRYEQRIMNLLPFVIIIYINMTSAGFMDIMYESLSGRMIMSLCLGLTVLSYYLSNRILDIRL